MASLIFLYILGQSGSMNRYLASLVKIPGFYPKDPVDLAYCDMIHETAQEIAPINPIVNVWVDETFQQKKTEFFENILPSKLNALYKLLGDKKFFCGDVVTYCDFNVYHQLDLCRYIDFVTKMAIFVGYLALFGGSIQVTTLSAA